MSISATLAGEVEAAYGADDMFIVQELVDEVVLTCLKLDVAGVASDMVAGLVF